MRKPHFKPLYQLSIKGLEKTDHFKQRADLAVKDIMNSCGKNLDIKLHLEPEAKRRKVFTVALSTASFENELVVKKSGRNIYSILRHAKRKFIRNARRLSEQKTPKRKRATQPQISMFDLEEAI